MLCQDGAANIVSKTKQKAEEASPLSCVNRILYINMLVRRPAIKYYRDFYIIISKWVK